MRVVLRLASNSVARALALVGALALFSWLPCPVAAQSPAATDQQVRFLATWGSRGDGPGQFYSPIGIAINQRDEVYVTDVNNARVQRFTAEGQHLGTFDLPRDTPERRSSQAGSIVVDAEGLIYASFMQQNKIIVFRENGEVVREWGDKGSEPGQLDGPGGLALHKDGTLWVADQRNHRVQQFTKTGELLRHWGGYGSQPGQFGEPETKGSRFAGPHFIALDSKDRIYTTEGVAARIQQLTLGGEPIAAWGDHSGGPGGFGGHALAATTRSMGPVAIAVDRFDRVYVSSLDDRVQCFTTDGKYLFELGGSGTEPGQFDKPHTMAFDSHDQLYVVDASNQRIQKFAVPLPPDANTTNSDE